MSAVITGIALDGAGHHPAAWRDPATAPASLLHADRIVALVQDLDRAGVDLVTLTDSLGPAGTGPGELRPRLDALVTLARVAPVTERIGLIPTVTTTHTEPFHLQAAVATLDWVSRGRAGWQIAVSDTEIEATSIGRRGVLDAQELWSEATEVAQVSRLLWDSWEDDAEIRDVATGRFIDRDRLHYVDFVGRTFSVKGPSIVPRSPQGQPVVTVALTGPEVLATAAAVADIVLVAEPDADAAAAALATVRRAAARAGRDPNLLRVLADRSVLVADELSLAHARRAALDAAAGRDARLDVVTTPDGLVDDIATLTERGFDGVLLRPAVLAVDLPVIVEKVLPRLPGSPQAEPATSPVTLRDRLGLPRPENQFVQNRRGA